MGGRALLGCLDSLALLSRGRKDLWGGSGQFLAPRADAKAKIGEGQVPDSKQKGFPPKCLPCGVRDEESLIPASTKPPKPELGAVSSRSLCILPCCCCHHKLEIHPRGSRKPLS